VGLCLADEVPLLIKNIYADVLLCTQKANPKHLNNLSKKEVKKMLFALKEKGQGMVEYALILVLVAVVVIAAVTIMGPLVGKVFSTINKSL
jgi:pilus assembly protein Flp/PilA